MCLIIDANAASEVAATPSTKAAKPILQWMRKPKGQLAVGGHLTEELRKTPFLILLTEMFRSGMVVTYSRAAIEAAQSALAARKICVSDDLHILALAQVSGARVIFSRDKKTWQRLRKPSRIAAVWSHI